MTTSFRGWYGAAPGSSPRIPSRRCAVRGGPRPASWQAHDSRRVHFSNLPPIVIRLVRHEGIPRAVADMQHRDYAVGLVNRVDNPVAVPPAPVKQVATIAVLGGVCAPRAGCSSRLMTAFSSPLNQT